jgi:hypothetical protein
VEELSLGCLYEVVVVLGTIIGSFYTKALFFKPLGAQHTECVVPKGRVPLYYLLTSRRIPSASFPDIPTQPVSNAQIAKRPSCDEVPGPCTVA